jgi:tRNA-splicing ligase RtcB
MQKQDLKKIEGYLYEIPKSYRPDMRVPAQIYADDKMLDKILTDRSLEQTVNVATLPGIVNYSLAMPDVHEGYGAPIGGVAAFDPKKGGIISPGMTGYDINCGVRLLRSELTFEKTKSHLIALANQIQRDVPSGLGRGTGEKLTEDELNQVLNFGARWCVKKGYGKEEDLEFLEEGGCFSPADAKNVSARAKKRGEDQVGTLGSGNHFLEIQRVEKIFDKKTAEIFGLFENQITFLIHTGSRGLGHQVATDYIRLMLANLEKYKITLPDRELACVPFESPEGQRYFSAMASSANFAWANRQMICFRIREAVKRILSKKFKSLDLPIVYDVAHNIVKIEEYNSQKLCVHRKGATRAFGPNQKEIPKKYQETGQPVLIPGSMGTASYVLAGTREAMENTFGSTCHGAGREMSRAAAKKMVSGNELRRKLEQQGIVIRCESNRGLAEEAPFAYKDVDKVIDVVSKAKISRKVARLVPLAVIKGG